MPTNKELRDSLNTSLQKAAAERLRINTESATREIYLAVDRGFTECQVTTYTPGSRDAVEFIGKIYKEFPDIKIFTIMKNENWVTHKFDWSE